MSPGYDDDNEPREGTSGTGDQASEDDGFSAVAHQQEVGAGYFEEVAMAITGGESETTALSGSTEESQF